MLNYLQFHRALRSRVTAPWGGHSWSEVLTCGNIRCCEVWQHQIHVAILPVSTYIFNWNDCAVLTNPSTWSNNMSSLALALVHVYQYIHTRMVRELGARRLHSGELVRACGMVRTSNDETFLTVLLDVLVTAPPLHIGRSWNMKMIDQKLTV